MIDTKYVMKRTLAQSKLLTKRSFAKAFTLVELLIVIALLGVIATIVIAAINPIEQANRASDSGMKADASQLVSAFQRYYTTHGEFPWNSGASPLVATPDLPLPWTSADAVGLGLCATASCKTETTHGTLIDALELQTAFLSKNWINPTTADRTTQLMVGKGTGSSSSVYVCWIPKSNSNRQNLINSANTTNKMVTTAIDIGANGIPEASTACTTTSVGWAAADGGQCSECVPE